MNHSWEQEAREDRDAKALKMFQEAARKFIAKVESGQARSRETYADLKAALAESERTI